MARLSTVLIPSCDTPITLSSLGASAASAIQTVGKNRLFAINADQDLIILFGNNAGPTISPTATFGYRIPANQQDTLDTGNAFDSFKVFNLSPSTVANVYIQLLTVV